MLLSAVAGLAMLSGMAAVQAAPVAAAAAITALPVPLFFQQDTRWGSDPIGRGCTSLMKDQGCAVTSVAMVYAYFGMVWTQGGVTGMDPKIVAKYVPGCQTDWKSRGFSDWIAASTVDLSNPTLVLNELRAGRPVIAQVHNTVYTAITMHFVVITGWTGTQYIVNNPDKNLQGYLAAQHYVLDAYRTVNTAVIGKNVFTVNDTTSGFTISGNAGISTTVGYAAGTHWATTVVSLPNGQPSTHADWSATMPAAGYWKVYVWVPRAYSTAATAYYSVHSGSSQETVTISQLAYSDTWILLGTYYYSAGQVATVSLTNVTGHSGDQIAYDAVRWNLP